MVQGVERRGLMMVLSSPSGAGKSTLTRLLVDNDRRCRLSISATTRAPRPGEVDGQHYFFLSREKFIAMRDAGEFLEWAEVFGNLYGTPRAPVEKSLQDGQDVIFDIDWQGTQQLHEKAARDLVRLFILPPSAEVLEQRLRARAQDPIEVVQRRMRDASKEISHWAEYDYVIINQDVDESIAAVRAILAAERLKRERQVGLAGMVRQMQSKLP